ncbi:MAG: hypothetical protein ACLT4C_02085 [Butyricicoccus sp.]
MGSTVKAQIFPEGCPYCHCQFLTAQRMVTARSSAVSYYRWYLLNPKLLICFFPFAGQESAHHKMIIDMLVLCARRGMAVWIISSGIDAICEKTDNEEFLRRLRYIKE